MHSGQSELQYFPGLSKTHLHFTGTVWYVNELCITQANDNSTIYTLKGLKKQCKLHHFGSPPPSHILTLYYVSAC